MDYTALGEKIQAQDFEHVFMIDGEAVVDAPRRLYAPDVTILPDADVSADGAGGDWQCLTGMISQYGYRGAVMHPSEFIGAGIARELAERSATAAEDGNRLAFAVVEVRDEDGDFPGGDPIGWAIAYLELPEAELSP